MKRTSHISSLILLSCALNACAGLPQSQSVDGISVDLITTAVQCEIAQAYVSSERATWGELDKYDAGVKLELKVHEENTASANVKLVVPIHPVAFDSLTLTGGPTIDNTSYVYTTLNFSAPLKAIHQHFVRADGTLSDECTGHSGFSPAATNLGLGTWVAESLQALNQRQNVAELDDMSYMLEFILVRDVNGSVAFVSNRVNPATLSADSKRTRDNALTVSFIKETPPAGPQKVLIVGLPPISTNPAEVRRPGPGPEPQIVVPAPAKPRTKTQTPASRPAISDDTKQRLEYLNSQHKLNSVITPKSQIVPY